METTTIKTVKVKCDNSRSMDSIESASVTVTSPTGKSIFLKKRFVGSQKSSKEMNNIFWKCCNDPMVRFIGEVELTIEEMKLALQFSQLR
jgi:hypothetical protein